MKIADAFAVDDAHFEDSGLLTRGEIIRDEVTKLFRTERVQVEHAIDRLLDGRTGVVIAHRLATIERVDQVLILGSQGVRESGSREALELDPDSTFSQLLRAGAQELLA